MIILNIKKLTETLDRNQLTPMAVSVYATAYLLSLIQLFIITYNQFSINQLSDFTKNFLIYMGQMVPMTDILLFYVSWMAIYRFYGLFFELAGTIYLWYRNGKVMDRCFIKRFLALRFVLRAQAMVALLILVLLYHISFTITNNLAAYAAYPLMVTVHLLSYAINIKYALGCLLYWSFLFVFLAADMLLVLMAFGVNSWVFWRAGTYFAKRNQAQDTVEA